MFLILRSILEKKFNNPETFNKKLTKCLAFREVGRGIFSWHDEALKSQKKVSYNFNKKSRKNAKRLDKTFTQNKKWLFQREINMFNLA